MATATQEPDASEPTGTTTGGSTGEPTETTGAAPRELVLHDDQLRRARLVEATAIESRESRLDVSLGSGRYLVAGRYVDANGQPVAEGER